MKNIKYAIYDGDYQKGGVYNVLASFSRGLLKGFKELGVSAFAYDECFEKKLDYDVVVGFNLAGLPHWKTNLNSPKFNLIWNVDTIFGQNFEIFKQCESFDNFALLNVSSSDFEASKKYMPNLNVIRMLHATDEDLWKEEKNEKDIDIVFFSSLYDHEKILEEYKENKLLYGIINEMIDMMLKRPNTTFWENFNIIKSACKFDLEINDYAQLNKIVCLIVEQKQKIKMIHALSNLNVKVYGNDLWNKYVKGKVEYKGSLDLMDSIKIMNKSKISLNCQASVLNCGLHERILNASSVSVFSLVSATPFIQEEFSETFGYFNHATFEDIEQKAQYYLKNNDERIQKAKEAQKIVHQKHLWKNRALQIDEIFTQE